MRSEATVLVKTEAGTESFGLFACDLVLNKVYHTASQYTRVHGDYLREPRLYKLMLKNTRERMKLLEAEAEAAA